MQITHHERVEGHPHRWLVFLHGHDEPVHVELSSEDRDQLGDDDQRGDPRGPPQRGRAPRRHEPPRRAPRLLVVGPPPRDRPPALSVLTALQRGRDPLRQRAPQVALQVRPVVTAGPVEVGPHWDVRLVRAGDESARPRYMPPTARASQRPGKGIPCDTQRRRRHAGTCPTRNPQRQFVRDACERCKAHARALPVVPR